MFRKYLLHIVLLFDLTQLQAQSPTLNWQVTIGGSEIDYGRDIFQIDSTTSAYAPAYRVSVVGRTASQDGTVINCAATDTDAFFTQIDTNGVIVSCTTLGGSCYEEFNKGKYVTTTSGQVNAVLLGRTCSNDRDVNGNHGSFDAWMVRTDFGGNVINKKCIGGKGWEDIFDFVEMPDKGFLMCGVSSSDTIDGLQTGTHGNWDGWILRTDSVGNILWNKQYGGSFNDFLYSIVKTHDGNFVIAGFTNSNDGNISGNHGFSDYWILKIDSLGNIIWQKVYGGSSNEYAYKIVETDSDFGFVVSGYTYSFNGDVIGNNSNSGSTDTWLIKTDSIGNLLWNKCFGGASDDFCFSMAKTNNGCFILPVFPNGWGGNPYACQGTQPFKTWIVKIDSLGNIKWSECFGTVGTVYFDGFSESIIQIDFNHFYFISHPGFSGGNVTVAYGGSHDIWLAKIKDNSVINLAENNLTIHPVEIFPNPMTDNLTIKMEEGSQGQLNIKNCLGKILISKTIDASLKSVNISSFMSGLYLIEIIMDNKTNNYKFIKTN
jgi:hypothetical protein